jgi:hypothetical protein
MEAVEYAACLVSNKNFKTLKWIFGW